MGQGHHPDRVVYTSAGSVIGGQLTGVIGLGRFGRLHSLTLSGIAEAELVAMVARRQESIDALVNGAGHGPKGPVLDYDDVQILADKRQPQLDLKQDFVELLGDEVTFIRDSIGDEVVNETFVAAVTLRDAKRFAQNVQRVLKDDKSFEQIDANEFVLFHR